MAKRGRPSKDQLQLDGAETPLEAAPVEGFRIKDEKALSQWLLETLTSQIKDRSDWHMRRKQYLPMYRKFMRDNIRQGSGPWKQLSDFHVPITFWMMKQMHARLMATMFDDGIGFTTRPNEKLDRALVERTDFTMRWAITEYANNWEGINLTIDDWIWGFVGEGWSVLKRNWLQKKQKMVLTNEELEKINLTREPDEIIESLTQIVTRFDGPVIEWIPHEEIIFPAKMKNVSDLNEPDLVAQLLQLNENDLVARGEFNGWDKSRIEDIIKGGGSFKTTGETEIDEDKRITDFQAGVPRVDSDRNEELWNIYECYIRHDVDEDRFDEDLVVWFHKASGTILHWTLLDRISPRLMKRPLHKIDFLRREGNAYSPGMAEILFSLQKEINAMHRQRIDFGTIASIPFFFFKPSSGMKRQKMELAPGMGIPLDDPQKDVMFPQFKSQVAFTRFEEEQIIQYAERTVALPPITSGQSQSPVGSLTTATGVASVLNQIGFDFDVILNRVKVPYQQFLKGLHSDLEFKMPNGLEFRLLGSKAQDLLNADGLPRTETSSRLDIAGNFDFRLVANARSINRESEKQEAQLTFQTLLNPILIQMGIVSPQNVFNGLTMLLKKRGVIAPEELSTNPSDVEIPLTLANEIAVIVQGDAPRIVMNDDHNAKVEGLELFANTPGLDERIANGSFSSDTVRLLTDAIKEHGNRSKAIEAQSQLDNISGSQISPTLGARMSGELSQQQGVSLAEAGQRENAGSPEVPVEEVG